MFEDVVATIVRAAAEQPLTIIIDDADKMTDLGQDLLVSLAAQLSLRKVLIVVTARRVLERVERTGTTLILQGLAESAVGALLREHGIAAEDDIVRAVHTGTRGNPSDVIDLLPALRSSATADDVVEAMITFAEHEAKARRTESCRSMGSSCVHHRHVRRPDCTGCVAVARGRRDNQRQRRRPHRAFANGKSASTGTRSARQGARLDRSVRRTTSTRLDELGDPRQTADAAVALAGKRVIPTCSRLSPGET